MIPTEEIELVHSSGEESVDARSDNDDRLHSIQSSSRFPQSRPTFGLRDDEQSEVLMKVFRKMSTMKSNKMESKSSNTVKDIYNALTPTAEEDAAIAKKKKNQQRDVEDLMKDLQGDSNLRRQIEIKNGQIQMMNNKLLQQTNQLAVNRYRVSYLLIQSACQGFKGFLLFLADTFLTLDFIIVLIFFILYTVAETDNFSYTPHLIIGTISVLAQAILNYIVDSRQRQAQEEVNNKPIEIAQFKNRKKYFKIKTWKDVQIGSIVKLFKNQEAPADILILDIRGSKTENQTCYMKNGIWDSSTTPVLKHSYPGTASKPGLVLYTEKFINSISGTLKWDYNHFGAFVGYFKQENNATAVQITQENIIMRGCYISQAEFIIGIVLNIGDNTLASGETLRKRGRHELFDAINDVRSISHTCITRNLMRTMYQIWVGSLVICAVPCILLLIESLWKDSANYQFHQYLDKNSNWLQQSGTFITTFIYMMQSLPYMTKLSFDILTIFQSFYAVWDANLVPTGLKFNNLLGMSNLATLDSIILDKKAIFHKQIYKVEAVMVGNVLYDCDVSFLQQAMQGVRYQETAKDSSDSSDNETFEVDYMPSDVVHTGVFYSSEVSKIMRKNTLMSERFNEFLLALSICHNAQRRIDFDQTDRFKSLYSDDIEQLYFARSLGFLFLARQNNVINIKKQEGNKGYNLRIEEHLNMRIQLQDEWVMVSVVKMHFAKESFIYIKGGHETVRRMVVNQPDQLQMMEECKTGDFLRKGQQCITFAKKPVDEKSMEVLIRLINESKTGNKKKEEELKNFVLSQLTRMRCIGSLGMSPVYNVRDNLVLEELIENGIKLWMVSDCSAEKNAADYEALDLFDNYHKPLRILGSTEKQVEDSIKILLKTLNERMHNDNDEKQKVLKEQNGRSLSSELQHRKRDLSAKRKSEYHPKKPEEKKVQLKNSACVSGEQINLICKDESLLVLFFTLTSFCELVTLNKMDSIQRAMVAKRLCEFNANGGKGAVMGIINNSHDRFLVKNCDVSLSLQKFQINSDLKAASDIVMNDIYGLTYLLLRHSTQMRRRLVQLLENFVYRSVLMQVVLICCFLLTCFSAQTCFPQIFIGFFWAVFTPASIICASIFHKNFGYSVFHRISGEYKSNSVLDFWHPTMATQVIFKGVIDGLILYSIFISRTAVQSQQAVMPDEDGQLAGEPSIKFYLSLGLSISFWNRMRDCNTLGLERELSSVLILLLSLLILLSDDRLEGPKQFAQSPVLILQLVFIILFQFFRNWLFLVLRVTVPFTPCTKSAVFYSAIEDQVLLEQYDNQDIDLKRDFQEERCSQMRQVLQKINLNSVNVNMMRVQRSDSLDQLLDSLNRETCATVKTNSKEETKDSNGIISKCTLKLADVNKEQMYIRQSNQPSVSVRKLKTIKLTIAGFLCIFIQNIVEYSQARKEVRPSLKEKNTDLALNLCGILFSAITLYLITKTTISRTEFVVKAQAIISVVFLITEKLIESTYDDKGRSIQNFGIFYFCLLILVAHRFTHVFIIFAVFIALITVHSSLLIKHQSVQNKETESQNTKYYVLINSFVLLTFWSFYIYKEEMLNKVKFAHVYRRVKDYLNLKKLTSILVPHKVRTLVDSKKGEVHPEVTVLYCEIADFDEIVALYQMGPGLIELLDDLQRVLDVLCEQFGLTKVEQVAKQFTVCGGLKTDTVENQQLLGIHHSVRVLDFALALNDYAKQTILRNDRCLPIKFAVASGQVFAGVIGEIKPQYSLFGETMWTVKHICAHVDAGKINVTQSVQKVLMEFSNTFEFKNTPQDQFKEIKERIITVRKKRAKKTVSRKNSSLYFERFNSVDSKKDKKNRVPVGKESISSVNFSEELKKLDHNDEDSNSEMQYDSNQSIDQELSKDSIQKTGNIQTIYDSCEFRTDHEILLNQALNEIYQLVERPKSLLSFQNDTQECIFSATLVQENPIGSIVITLFSSLIDFVLIYKIVDKHVTHKWIHIIWIFIWALLIVADYFIRRMCLFYSVKLHQATRIAVFSFSILVILISGPMVFNIIQNLFVETLIQTTLLMAFLNRTITFRPFLIMCCIAFAGQTCSYFFAAFSGKEQKSKEQLLDLLLAFVNNSILAAINYEREMIWRKCYNEDRVLSVEKEKTENMICQLVPFHILDGIRNNKQIIDEIDHVTILFAKCVGASSPDVSRESLINLSTQQHQKQSTEFVNQLSALFSKFDGICELRELYKVHTYGDTYVIMSYNGRLPTNKRFTNDLVDEAINTMFMAIEMLDIVAELNGQLHPSQQMEMKIGIHTGKIVGGLIGQNFVRYDIFGPAVLTAFKIMNEGLTGTMRVSEMTHDLVRVSQSVFDLFVFTADKEVTANGKVIQTYNCEHIFDEDYSSDTFSSHTESQSASQLNSPAPSASIDKEHYSARQFSNKMSKQDDSD